MQLRPAAVDEEGGQEEAEAGTMPKLPMVKAPEFVKSRGPGYRL